MTLMDAGELASVKVDEEEHGWVDESGEAIRCCDRSRCCTAGGKTLSEGLVLG